MNILYDRVMMELNLKRNRLSFFIFDIDKGKFKTLLIPDDEKKINPTLWKHLPTAIECKTSETVLKILQNLQTISLNGQRIQPFSSRYVVTSEKITKLLEADFPTLIHAVRERIKEKASAESYVTTVATAAGQVYNQVTETVNDQFNTVTNELYRNPDCSMM